MSREFFDSPPSSEPSNRFTALIAPDQALSQESREKKTNRRHARIALAKQAFYGVTVAGVSLTTFVGASFSNEIIAMNTHTPTNDAMSEIASSVLDADVRVDCNDTELDKYNEKTLGIVAGYSIPSVGDFALPVMTLRESLCDYVIDYKSEPPTTTDSLSVHKEYYSATTTYARYIGVLLHEGQHINGNLSNEAAAECYALQQLPQTLEELGFDETSAQYYSQAVADKASYGREMQYYSVECREGGELDLGISDVYVTYEPPGTQSKINAKKIPPK